MRWQTMSKPRRHGRFLGLFAQAYGLLGVVLLLCDAIVRLVPMAWRMWLSERTLFQTSLLVLVIVFFAYFEGHKGFAKSLAPRLGARLHVLADEPTLWRVCLAPLFLMALIDATKKRLIVNWLLTFGIVGFIIMVRQLDAVYRGIVDAGVVVGLSWGTLSILYFSWRSLRHHEAGCDPEVARR